MLTVAVLGPNAPGTKVTLKVVLPPETIGDDGCVLTVKSEGFVQEIVTLVLPVRFKSKSPVFWMV